MLFVIAIRGQKQYKFLFNFFTHSVWLLFLCYYCCTGLMFIGENLSYMHDHFEVDVRDLFFIDNIQSGGGKNVELHKRSKTKEVLYGNESVTYDSSPMHIIQQQKALYNTLRRFLSTFIWIPRKKNEKCSFYWSRKFTTHFMCVKGEQ